MKWMKWLVVLVILLLVASIPATDAWAKGNGRDAGSREGDKGKDSCEEKPVPAPVPTVVAIPDRDASFVWFVMDRTDPTRRLAGPFYAEQSCRTSALGFNNAMCRAVRD